MSPKPLPLVNVGDLALSRKAITRSWGLQTGDKKTPFRNSFNQKKETVADASTFVMFRKQSAVAKNFNDTHYGGNKYSGAQSYLRAIRRRG